MTKKLISIRETAEYCGVGESTLWRWLKEERFPKPIRLGRRTLWEIEALDAFITSLRDK